MKKRTKLTIGALAVVAGALILSSCTASFCSKTDKAHILYAFDYGVCQYYDATNKPEAALQVFDDNANIYYTISRPASTGSGIGKTDTDAVKAGLHLPSDNYFVQFDTLVLKDAIALSGKTTATVTYQEAINALDEFGHVKFYKPDTENKKNDVVWNNWDVYNQTLRDMTVSSPDKIVLDDLPNNDYITLYKKDMNSLTASYRSCIAIDTAEYGYYGYTNGVQNKGPVQIEAKTWSYAWGRGFFEGLLVFPIGWLTETFVKAFKGAGMPTGLPQLLAIFAITFIVRSLMLLVTIKQTTGNAKMQALQPEITKIQNKYPNSNTNQYEKQQMAAEMQKLYKKNKINPFSTLLVMIVQFPVFICVWGALQGCASLSTDTFLNLHLSDSINNVLFNTANWSAAGGFSAFTALVLFLLMAGSQVISMLLPQWLQKAKAKKVASLGKNPAQNQQQNNMKIFTYVMMAMIIFMGFTLPSAMGVYWFVGALFSIIQTLIIDLINNRKSKKKGK